VKGSYRTSIGGIVQGLRKTTKMLNKERWSSAQNTAEDISNRRQQFYPLGSDIQWKALVSAVLNPQVLTESHCGAAYTVTAVSTHSN